jgi:hypothetical protein
MRQHQEDIRHKTRFFLNGQDAGADIFRQGCDIGDGGAGDGGLGQVGSVLAWRYPPQQITPFLVLEA